LKYNNRTRPLARWEFGCFSIVVNGFLVAHRDIIKRTQILITDKLESDL
jgi:hypothetical protein